MTGTLQAFLADPPPEKVTPGLLGFTVMFALALATVLLIRSMVGHLRKVRYGPGGPDGPPLQVDEAPRDAPASGSGSGSGAAPATGPSNGPATGSPPR